MVWSCYHSINNNNYLLALKGGSGSAVGQPQIMISFTQAELGLVNNALNIIRLYITRNPQQFQQLQREEILNKVNKSIDIISTQLPTTPTKGASIHNNNNNICLNKKKEHLKDLLRMFNL
jgi:hypothetical protein